MWGVSKKYNKTRRKRNSQDRGRGKREGGLLPPPSAQHTTPPSPSLTPSLLRWVLKSPNQFGTRNITWKLSSSHIFIQKFLHFTFVFGEFPPPSPFHPIPTLSLLSRGEEKEEEGREDQNFLLALSSLLLRWGKERVFFFFFFSHPIKVLQPTTLPSSSSSSFFGID